MPSIVTVNVTQTVAPTPETLQQSGAFISQGATTLTSGTSRFLTQLSDLTSILTTAAALSSLAWASSGGGTATATCSAAHGIPSGHTTWVTIAGASPVGYNGTFLATSTGTTTFTYPLTTNPGSSPATGSITWVPEDVAELLAMGTTFFGQGSATGVYVLELGLGSPADGVTALSTYITANPNSNYVPGAAGYYYAYLVPRTWAAEPTFPTFLAGFESTTAQTYFFVTTTSGTYTNFTVSMKCVVQLIEAPTIGATEFSLAAAFWQLLNQNPTSTNQVAPFAFRFLYGVTPYPTLGNQSTLATWKAANVNVVGTGAEGGISTAILLWGTAMDGNDFTYWYSVDWVAINVNINVSNAIINGSNNPEAPLYYNQQGINVLQAVVAQTMSTAISYGLCLGTITTVTLDGTVFAVNYQDGDYADQVVVNAVPFITYTTENPGDYKIGKYGGLAVAYTPSRGFIQIIFNVNVSSFVA